MSSLKRALRDILFRLAPEKMTSFMSARARKHSQRLVKEWGLVDLNHRLLKEVGNSVVSGPFRGLRLTSMTWQEHIGPYLLGTYEQEIHAWWNDIFKRRFDLIIDVGAKFGYYAFGLALRFPSAHVVAFDTDRWARKAMREMALANNVHSVSIKGFCTAQWLNQNVKSNTLIMSDCEGFEGQLFSEVDLDRMASSTLIIELHEGLVPGVTARIEQRFMKTHDTEKVTSRSKPFPTELQIRSLTKEEMDRASAEIRPEQQWLRLSPKIDRMRRTP